MMPALLRKELLALARDTRTLLLVTLFAILFIAVFVNAKSQVAEASARKALAEAQARAQWDQQGDRHPHRGAHFGLYVFAPSSVLAALDPGVTRYLGEALWLEPHRRNILRFSESESDVVSLRLGELSPAYLFTTVLSLLIFALSFNAVTQERESGTLRMSFGAGIRAQDLMRSKLLAQLTIPVFVVLLSFAVVLALTPAELADRVIYLMGAVLVYALILTALGLAVSAYCRTSQQALATLMLLWMAFTFIVPRGAAAMANALVPLPSAEQFWNAIKRDDEDGLPGDGTLAERGKRYDAALLKQYGLGRLEDLPVGAYALRRMQRDAYADKVHAIHFDRLWASYSRQEAIMAAAGVLSPAVALRLASMKLAGTDIRHRKDFEDQAEAYRQYVNTAIDTWDAAHSRGMRSFEEKYAGNSVWQSIRRFEYLPPAAGTALRFALSELWVLCGWLAAAAGLLVLATRKVRP